MANIADSTGSQIGEALRSNAPTRLTWTGFTDNAVAKEIFLISADNPAAGGRLIIPLNCVIVAEGLLAAYNVTDNNVFAIGRLAVGVTNLANTVAASGVTLEWDAAATDANPFVQYFVGAAPAVAITYNNTTKSLVVTVTGLAAKRINWRVTMQLQTAGS